MVKKGGKPGWLSERSYVLPTEGFPRSLHNVMDANRKRGLSMVTTWRSASRKTHFTVIYKSSILAYLNVKVERRLFTEGDRLSLQLALHAFSLGHVPKLDKGLHTVVVLL